MENAGTFLCLKRRILQNYVHILKSCLCLFVFYLYLVSKEDSKDTLKGVQMEIICVCYLKCGYEPIADVQGSSQN